jgi:hypothetical protein
MAPVANENIRTVIMNTLRRPILSPGQANKIDLDGAGQNPHQI